MKQRLSQVAATFQTEMHHLSVAISLVLLLLHAGVETITAKPPCVPIDWTITSDFLKFGTCNWPSDVTPCGKVVPVAGRTPGQRAWPYGLCTLKFSRTPWAPTIYSGEVDKTWQCGARFQFCWQGNSKANGFACGGSAAGTAKLCPEQTGGWKCEYRNQTYPESNCSGDNDLVLDVSSMGYPPELRNTRVKDANQCAAMCALRPLCNIWNFCNSVEGCGWTCQNYINVPRKKGLGKGMIIGIAVGGSAFVILLVFVSVFCCIRNKHRPGRNYGLEITGVATATSTQLTNVTPAKPTPPAQFPPTSGPNTNSNWVAPGYPHHQSYPGMVHSNPLHNTTPDSSPFKQGQAMTQHQSNQKPSNPSTPQSQSNLQNQSNFQNQSNLQNQTNLQNQSNLHNQSNLQNQSNFQNQSNLQNQSNYQDTSNLARHSPGPIRATHAMGTEDPTRTVTSSVHISATWLPHVQQDSPTQPPARQQPTQWPWNRRSGTGADHAVL